MIKPIDDYLFTGGDLREQCAAMTDEMLRSIDNVPQAALVATSIDDLAGQVVQGFVVHVPVLRVADTVVDKQEIDLDVSRDPNRMFLDRSVPHFIKATRITFSVPFDGDASIFSTRPPMWSSMTPRGTVASNELQLNYETDDHDANAVQARFDQEIRRISEYLGSVVPVANAHNNELFGKARQRLEARKAKLEGDQKLVQGLRFPLRIREDAPRTFEPPTVRRRVLPPTPAHPAAPAPRATAEPEPQPLAMTDYEHILGVCSSMVHVMERSPKAFAVLGEEDIRWHFLVQLNGHYEGMGAGEAFNFEGKTDILIRHGARNLFIAECKVWRGEVALAEAIDQVLGYLTWRDTKAALFVFNRNKDFTAVIEKMKAAVRAHPAFLRELGYTTESGARVVLRRPDDTQREILLTLLAFDIPQ